MKLEKIKNYNQKLLAVLLTALAILAIIGIISLLVTVISSISWRIRSNSDDDRGIFSEERIEELQEENKRQQLISYDMPRLIDTNNLIYIIPVSHHTLDNPEYIDEGVLGLLDGKGFEPDYKYSGRYYGSFHNLLIYDYKQQTIKKLFNERVNFGEIITRTYKDDILVLFKAADKDTYRDEAVNLTDLTSLYIYSIKEKKLRKITLENADVAYFNFVPSSKDLLIRFGLDHNSDGKFEDDDEPSVIKKYDYGKEILSDIVCKELDNELQRTLEGTKE